MRLTRVAKPFDDPDYIFELKHDGFRALAYINASECKLVSRNLNHLKSFNLLKKSLDKLPVQNAILDGEVVCLDSNGVSKFNELTSRKGKPVFYAFDLLWLDGKDLRSLPLIERKQRLYELIRGSRCHEIIYALHIEGQGVGFFQEICTRDLEGIVAKHKRGVYKNNGLGWKKIKNPKYSHSEGRHDLFKRMRER
jgi:bifunctional non-homologous end joining protein LigD